MYVCMIFVNVNIMLFQLNGILLSQKNNNNNNLREYFIYFLVKNKELLIEKSRLRLNKQGFKIFFFF